MGQRLEGHQKGLDNVGGRVSVEISNWSKVRNMHTSHPAQVVVFSISLQIELAVSLLLGTEALAERASSDPTLSRDTICIVPMEMYSLFFTTAGQSTPRS